MNCKKLFQLMGFSLLLACAPSYAAVTSITLFNNSLQTGGVTEGLIVDYARCDHTYGTAGKVSSSNVPTLNESGGILAVRAKVKMFGHYHHGPWAVFKDNYFADSASQTLNCDFGIYSGSLYPKAPYCSRQFDDQNVDGKVVYADSITADYKCY